MKAHILSDAMMKIFRDNAKSYLRKIRNKIETLEMKVTPDDNDIKKIESVAELNKVLTDYFTSSESHIEELESEIMRLEIENVNLKKSATFYKSEFEDSVNSEIETIEICRSKIS